MAAHLEKAPVEPSLPANEHGFDRGLHVVVNAAPTGAAEKGKTAVMSIKHHLLALARIGSHEQHPAVAEPDMGDLDRHRRAVDQHHIVAPVELVGFSRGKAKRHEGCCR